MLGVLLLVAPGALAAGISSDGARGTAPPIRLRVKEVPLTVHGRTVTAVAIEGPGGAHGLEVEQSDGFHVEVVNDLRVPTAIHWHGIVLPNAMDGVPFVTQAPIAPGAAQRYDFPLVQRGTYWMHSHYGLQEQFQASAPLIVWTPEERALADRQHVVMLSDFSFTPPEEILATLRMGMTMPGAMPGPRPVPDAPGAAPKADMPPMPGMPGMNAAGPKIEMTGQRWDVGSAMLVPATVSARAPDIDVTYDALLANRRTLDDPQVLEVKAGETVLLRLIAASSATNFLVDTGSLRAELIAVDGKGVEPVAGTCFQLAIAQRIDLRVRIPEGGGAFPILAQGEGTTQRCGVVLATPGAALPAIASAAPLRAAGLDNTQERHLRARRALPPRGADRSLPVVLGGDMMKYRWTLNDSAYPAGPALLVRGGERVELAMTNRTGMAHPMHLHGHDVQVVAIDGERVDGALRDTVLVPPGSTITIAFDADNPGAWAYHCHLLYHLVSGMFTVLRYEGTETPFWKPNEAVDEIAGLAPRSAPGPRSP